MPRSSSPTSLIKSQHNDTSSYGITGSFPHYKQVIMPADQRAKLLAMHRASRANAGIYVAVVLAIYVILLTMLLCRYAKRQRSSSSDGGSTPQNPNPTNAAPSNQGFCHFTTTTTIMRRWTCPFMIRCPRSLSMIRRENENIHEITEFPLTNVRPSLTNPRSSVSSVGSSRRNNASVNICIRPSDNGSDNKPVSV